MTTITLAQAINASSSIIVNGYDIDVFDYRPDGLIDMACCDDHVATVFSGQQVELDSDGCTSVQDTVDGSLVHFEFRVSRPLTLKDL